MAPGVFEFLHLHCDGVFTGLLISALRGLDGDCGHEIKRLLLLGRKAMTNLYVLVTQSCSTLCNSMG